MLFCKITNNTKDWISLNWVRGGIFIPKDSSAVLDYDPISLMDRSSNIYAGAQDIIKRGLVTIGYFAKAPAVMLDSLEGAPAKEKPVKKTDAKHEPSKDKGPFNTLDSYHEQEFQESVNIPKETKADDKAEPVVMDVNVPKDAPKQTAVPGGDPISPDAVPEVAPKKTSSKKTKKL